MDISTYIKRMNQLYGNEPAPVRYNTQQYLQGGRVGYKPGGIVEPGVVNYGKQSYYFYDPTHTSPHRVVGQKMIDGKLVESINTRFKLKKDAIAAAKAFETKVKDIVTPYHTVEGRIPKGKLTLLNKYSQFLFKKDYKELTDRKDIDTVQNRARKGKFVKKTMFDRLSPANEEKITKAFSNEFKIDFDNKGRYGVDRYLPGTKKTNPEYTAIRNFVEKGYRKTVKDLLSASDQRKVMNNFELPAGVKEWNFKKYIYGIPNTGSTNANLGSRILNNLAEKKDWVVAADRSSASGWMMNSMHRAWKNEVRLPNGQLAYEPKWETINGKKRIVGFTDNTTYGQGKTYYGLKKWNTIHKGTNWANHADFKNAEKFVSIAKKSYAEPNQVIMKLLTKKGVATDGRLTLNNVLNFLAKQEGKAVVEQAIVKHHMGGVGAKDALRARATNDIQLLTNTVNNEVRKIESRVLKNNKILPTDIAELKKLEASIRGPDNKLYGGGSKTASGGLKMIERQAIEKIKKWESKDVKKFNTYLQEFCGYTRSGGGRIGFKAGSCSLEVAQRNFLMATDDVAKGKVTGKAAEQITKNAGKVVSKAGSKSALASIFGISGLGLDIAYEIGSIGTDMAMDSNVTLKGALQNNWLTGFFIKGTGQEEYHKGLYNFDSSAQSFGKAMDLYARIEEEERALKRMRQGSDRVTVTEEMLSAQKQKIADLSSFFNQLARKEGSRYLALEQGSPEQVAYERAKQEYDSIGAAKALLKRTSKAGFEDSLKTSRAKPYEDYIKTLNPTYGVKHTYGNISKKEIDETLKAYGDEHGFGWTPYGLGYGMQQMKPGIRDLKYNEDLAYRQLAEDITNTKARSEIAEAGGIANMAAGGRIGFKAGGFDKGRRAFMKWLAGITGAGIAGGTGFIKLGKGAKTVAPKVTEEVVKRGVDGMPTYIDNLINVVQSKGVKNIIEGTHPKFKYDTVHTYKGVDVTEDAAGNIKIKHEHPNYSQEDHIQIQKGGMGVKDEGLETQKTFQEPDEYFEGTVRPDRDGKMKDADFHIDDADHLELKKIADEDIYDTYLPDIDDID